MSFALWLSGRLPHHGKEETSGLAQRTPKAPVPNAAGCPAAYSTARGAAPDATRLTLSNHGAM